MAARSPVSAGAAGFGVAASLSLMGVSVESGCRLGGLVNVGGFAGSAMSLGDAVDVFARCSWSAGRGLGGSRAAGVATAMSVTLAARSVTCCCVVC